MKKTIATILSLLVLAFHSSFAGSVLISWDIPTGVQGTSQGTVAAVTGLSGTPITLGSGLIQTAATSSGGWGGESFSGWTAVKTLDQALAAGDYFQWSVSVGTGYSLSLDGIGSLSMFRSGSGAGNTNNSIGLYYSIAGSAYTLAGQGPSTASGISSSSSSATSMTSLGSAWATTPLSVGEGQTITFRLAAFQANTNALGGTTRFLGTGTQDLSLTGFLTSLNAPYAWAGGVGTWATGSGGWDTGAWTNGKVANISGGDLTIGAGGVTAGAVTVSGTTNTIFRGGNLNAAGLTKEGASQLELANSGSVLTNGITVNGGTVLASANGVLNGAINLASGTTLNIGSTTNTVGNFTAIDASLLGSGKLTGASFSFSVGSGTTTVDAVLDGANSGISKSGAGVLRLTGANSYTGTTAVTGGVLETVGNERIHDNSILNPGTGSTIRLGGNETVGGLSASATSATIDLGGNNLTIGVANSSNSFVGVISGSGTVTKVGANIQTFDSVNTFTGGTTVKDGSIRLQASGSRVTNGDGSVVLSASGFGTGALTMEGGRIISSSTNSGRTIYNNVNINGDFALGSSATTASSITISTNVTGAATTLLKNAAITADSAVDWEQGISGSAFTLTKSGASQMTMRGVNSLDTINVSQGRLDMRGATTLGSINVASGAILGYGTTSAALGSATVNLGDGSTFGQVAGMGTTTADRIIANNINFLGNVTLGVGGYANYLGGNINLGGANRQVTFGNTTTFDGGISNGGLTLVASNKTVTFNGASTYSGGTTFATSLGGSTNNIIANNTTGSAFGTGAVTVQAGNNLGGSGIISGATTMETGSLLRPGNSPGVLTFGSDLTLNTGVNLVWELWANTEVNSPVTFDQVVVGGNLLFGGSNGVTLDFGTTAGGSLVNWTDTFWDSQRSWILYDVTGTTTGASNLSLLNSVYNDATGASLATARSGASFSIAQVGSDVVVNYIPEPSSSSLMLLGLSGLIGLRAFRRKV